ncbi:MAG: hypothetical protein WCJ56_07910 [bacterium]
MATLNNSVGLVPGKKRRPSGFRYGIKHLPDATTYARIGVVDDKYLKGLRQVIGVVVDRNARLKTVYYREKMKAQLRNSLKYFMLENPDLFKMETEDDREKGRMVVEDWAYRLVTNNLHRCVMR